MKELPMIACSLPADEQTNRAEEWRTLLQRATKRDRFEGGLRVSFAAVDAAQARALAAAEQECCPFFSFAFTEGSDGIAMSISAPLDAIPLIEKLFATL